jgi:hypothetical protein
MRSRHAGAVAAIIGSIGLLTISRNPRFDNFHAVDVLQLLASGMCYGVALAGLLNRLRTRQG